MMNDLKNKKDKKWIYLVFFLIGIISFPIGFILSISLGSMINIEWIWQLLLFSFLVYSIFFAIGLAAFKKQPQAYYYLKAFVASFAGMLFIFVMGFLVQVSDPAAEVTSQATEKGSGFPFALAITILMAVYAFGRKRR